MRTIRCISAWILLLVMATAMVPQKLWHACEHGTEVHYSDEDGPTVEASCALCTVGIPVATGPAVAELPLALSTVLQVIGPKVSGTALGTAQLTTVRGPPAC